MKSLLAIVLLGSIFMLPPQRDYLDERMAMVKYQIQQRGVRDAKTLEAMRKVPRHQFIPEKIVQSAYQDSPLPIGHGQTISQPYIVAYMTEVLQLDENDIALEVGTGSGYQAAILSEIVKEVYTIEIIEALASSAKETLTLHGYDNVQVYHQDGYYGLEEKGPFDAIMVTAASEHIPPPLIEQLKDGGRMIIPVGTPYFTQQLVLVTKNDGKAKTTNLLPVRFVPFTREKR